MQFPLDICRALTCHRAQGQTLANCTVSVDLGLDNPDRPMPADITSILYVACIRVTRLSDLFVSYIFPHIWEKIEQHADDIERRTVEEKLKQASMQFSSEKGMLREMTAELDWKPNQMNYD